MRWLFLVLWLIGIINDWRFRLWFWWWTINAIDRRILILRLGLRRLLFLGLRLLLTRLLLSGLFLLLFLLLL